MDEERLGIGVESDTTGLADFEDAMLASLDRIDQQVSGRVIEGPEVRPPEPDLSNVERAVGRVHDLFAGTQFPIEPDVSPVAEARALVGRELRDLAAEVPRVRIDADTGPLDARLTDARRLVEAYGQAVRDSQGGFNARASIKAVSDQIEAQGRAFEHGTQQAAVYEAALSRLRELRDQSSGTILGTGSAGGGNITETVGELEALGQLLDQDGTKSEALQSAFRDMSRTIQQSLDETVQGSQEADLAIGRLLNTIQAGAVNADEGPRRLHDALVAVREEASENPVVIRANTEPLEQDLAAAHERLTESRAAVIDIDGNVTPLQRDLATIEDIVRSTSERIPAIGIRSNTAEVEAGLRSMHGEIDRVLADVQTGTSDVANVSFTPLIDGLRETRAQMDFASKAALVLDDAVDHLANRRAEVDTGNIGDAINEVREAVQGQPTSTNIVDTAGDRAELEALASLIQVTGEAALALNLNPASADVLNRALIESRSNAELATQNFAAFRASAVPALEELGLAAAQASPLTEALWNDLLRGKIVVEGVAGSTSNLVEAVRRLAETTATPPGAVVTPAQTAEVEHLSRALTEASTHLDEFTRLRAESQVADPTTGNVPISPLPQVVPNDLPEETRQLQILGSGIADVGRHAEETESKVSSLRETMTAQHQTAARVTRENANASAQLTNLGATMRRATDASHAHAEGLTFEGLAIRRASQAMAGLAATSLEAEGPLFSVAEALAGIVIPHAAILLAAAAVAGLAAAWNLVHEAARRAKEEENEALQSFIKRSEAQDIAERQGTIAVESREILAADRERLELAVALKRHYGDVIGLLVSWVDLQKTINLETRLTESIERDAARQRTIDQEARRTGAVDQRAQAATELNARRQLTIRIGEATVAAERQVATQRVAIREAEAENALSAAQATAAAQTDIDRQFFNERTRLAQESATATVENLQEQIADERDRAARSGPGIPEETETQKQDRAKRIQGLEEQAVQVRIQLALQLQQIDAERRLANLTRERALQQAQLTEDARTHQERVARAGGGNRPADFGGVGIVPTLAPDALALTNEQLRLLEANIKPLEIPIILRPASQREPELDVVGQEFRERAEQSQRFARTLDAVGGAVQNLSHVAETLNIIGEEFDVVIGQGIEFARGLGSIRATADAIRTAGTEAERFELQLAQIGNLAGVIGAAVGVVAGVAHALFGGGEDAHDRLIRENTEAIERNTAKREVEERFTGIGGQLDFANRLDDALEQFTALADARFQSIQELVQSGVARDIAALQVEPAPNLEAQLAEFGLTLEQVEEIASQFDLTVVDDQGHLVAASLAQLDKEIRDTIVATFKWGQTLDDQERKLRLESRLRGVEQTPRNAFEQEFQAAVNAGSDAIRQAFENVDFGDPESVRRALLGLERQFTDRTLDFEEIGRLSRDDFLRFLEDGADFLDSFNQSVDDASQRLGDLNIPEGFRRAAIAFETGTPGPIPGPTPPPPVLVFPGGPVVEPRPTDRGVFIDPEVLQEQTDATEDAATASRDQTEVIVRATASTDALVSALDRQLDATNALVRALEGRGVTATPPSTTGLQSPTSSARSVTIHGGLTIPVTVHAGPGASAADVHLAGVAGVKAALRHIGLVQSGDTLQFPVY